MPSLLIKWEEGELTENGREITVETAGEPYTVIVGDELAQKAKAVIDIQAARGTPKK